jgi:hypothetical protein
MTNVTSLVSTFNPFRYIFSPSTQLYRGNVTVLNTHPGNNTSNTDACLDEVSNATLGLTGSFQITIVFLNTPPGVRLVNRTGVTASGHSYISTAGPVPFVPGRPIRFPVLFSNPLRMPLSTFFQGPTYQVWAGPFDPTRV